MGERKDTKLEVSKFICLLCGVFFLLSLLSKVEASPFQRRSADSEIHPTTSSPDSQPKKAIPGLQPKPEIQKKKTPEDHKKRLHDPKNSEDVDLYDEDLATDYDIALDLLDQEDFERLLSLLSRPVPVHKEETVRHTSHFLDRHDELVHPSSPPSTPPSLHLDVAHPLPRAGGRGAHDAGDNSAYVEDPHYEEEEEEEDEEVSEDQQRLAALYLQQMAGGQGGVTGASPPLALLLAGGAVLMARRW